MKKLTLLPILLILSAISILGNVTLVHSEEQNSQEMTLQNAQNKEIQFEDKNIEAMVKLELSVILGHSVTESDMTQENLNKITQISTFPGSSITTLNDLAKMPNLEEVGIYASTGSAVLDTSALSNLNNLKNFTFWFVGAHLTSLEPLIGKPLENLTIKSLPLLDHSEKEINTMSSLKVIDMTYFSNDKIANVGSLDSLPQLREISLSSMGLTSAPTLKASTQLEYADFSSNNLTEIPNLTQSNLLWFLSLDRNAITNYTNVENILTLSSEPTVSLAQNLLTTFYNGSYINNLDLSGNFILGHDLPNQIAMKNIESQNLSQGEQKEIPIEWVDESQYPTVYDFTSHQKEFTDLKNMSIKTDNDNITIDKNGANLIIKAANNVQGTTHVVLSYQGDLKTEFDVTVS
jgi:hypothetical protein